MKNCTIKGKEFTREDVLIFIYKEFIKPLLSNQASIEIDNEVRVSIGFPSNKKANGECWHKKSGEGFNHIFISPSVRNVERITDILIHEAIHTKIKGHGKKFTKVCDDLGLEKPYESTVANMHLLAQIQTFLSSNQIEWKEPICQPEFTKKKQTTRMIKLECECGYIVRTSRANIVEKSVPTCSCGSLFNYDAEDLQEDTEETEN